MNPKKYKEFYADIAQECNAHIDLVNDLVSFFYGRVRNNLTNLEHSKLYIPNLGTFSIRKNRLIKKIKRNKDILGNLEKMTYKGYQKHIPIKEKIQLMEKLLKIIEEKQTNKKKFRDENK